METKFFVLFGTNVITPHIADESEVIGWARKVDGVFNRDEFATNDAAFEAAKKILTDHYKAFALFAYSPAGMVDFMDEAKQAGELVGLAAIGVAKEFVDEAHRAVMVALTDAQQTVMERVQFPIAGAEGAFQEYQETIAHIRGLSIGSLYEYVQNNDSTPE